MDLLKSLLDEEEPTPTHSSQRVEDLVASLSRDLGTAPAPLPAGGLNSMVSNTTTAYGHPMSMPTSNGIPHVPRAMVPSSQMGVPAMDQAMGIPQMRISAGTPASGIAAMPGGPRNMMGSPMGGTTQGWAAHPSAMATMLQQPQPGAYQWAPQQMRQPLPSAAPSRAQRPSGGGGGGGQPASISLLHLLPALRMRLAPDQYKQVEEAAHRWRTGSLRKDEFFSQLRQICGQVLVEVIAQLKKEGATKSADGRLRKARDDAVRSGMMRAEIGTDEAQMGSRIPIMKPEQAEGEAVTSASLTNGGSRPSTPGIPQQVSQQPSRPSQAMPFQQQSQVTTAQPTSKPWPAESSAPQPHPGLQIKKEGADQPQVQVWGGDQTMQSVGSGGRNYLLQQQEEGGLQGQQGVSVDAKAKLQTQSRPKKGKAGQGSPPRTASSLLQKEGDAKVDLGGTYFGNAQGGVLSSGVGEQAVGSMGGDEQSLGLIPGLEGERKRMSSNEGSEPPGKRMKVGEEANVSSLVTQNGGYAANNSLGTGLGGLGMQGMDAGTSPAALGRGGAIPLTSNSTPLAGFSSRPAFPALPTGFSASSMANQGGNRHTTQGTIGSRPGMSPSGLAVTPMTGMMQSGISSTRSSTPPLPSPAAFPSQAMGSAAAYASSPAGAGRGLPVKGAKTKPLVGVGSGGFPSASMPATTGVVAVASPPAGAVGGSVFAGSQLKRPSDVHAIGQATAKKSKPGEGESIEQLNDVTAVSGVNLREEEERLQALPAAPRSEAERRQAREEERLFLEVGPLRAKVAAAAAKVGIRSSEDALKCLSAAAEERLRVLLGEMLKLAKQRMDLGRMGHRVVSSSTVLQQLRRIEKREREALQQRKAEEAERLRKLGEKERKEKGGALGEAQKEEMRAKAQKAKELEEDKQRAKSANEAAKAAVGLDPRYAKWMREAEMKKLAAEKAAQQQLPPPTAAAAAKAATAAEGREDSMGNGGAGGGEEEGGGEYDMGLGGKGSFGKGGGFGKRHGLGTPGKRKEVSIGLKDVIAVLEREPQMCKSDLLYKLYEKERKEEPDGGDKGSAGPRFGAYRRH